MYWGGGLLLTLLVISGVISYLGNKTLVLDDVSLKEVVSDNSFAIYVDDGTAGDETDDKNYVEYDGDTFPLKADGYKYNSDKSTCIDNNGNLTTEVTLYYNNDMIQISTSETVYCYIYFDLYTTKGDWCLANEITDNLGECALVMDDYSYTVEAAKESIEDKGEATTSAISPTIVYGQIYSEVSSDSCLLSGVSTIASSYIFGTSTGVYTLSGATSIDTETDYTNYYAVTGTKMYQILEYTIIEEIEINYICIKKAKLYTYSINDSIDSEVGLYMTYDDDGPTYYYRGNVKNNYVYFAGYYWRIIRINGDGSIRMIYAGTDPDDTSDDQVGTSVFNETSSDPTYSGYKYGTISSKPVIQEDTANFLDFKANTTYYFGTSYEEVGDGTFKLSGTIISGTFSELFGSDGTYEDNITDYYTCFGAKETSTCTVLKKLNAYNSSKSASVYYISYASTSYADTLTNENDSTIKIVVDNWYKENILGKYDESETNLLSDYISASSTFCVDRALYKGSGYMLSAYTQYSSYDRLYLKSNPTLYCSTNSEDLYSVENGNLDYPIGLITIDEVAFAGGKYNNVNTLYYLYTGSEYWTMTPSFFYPDYLRANVWSVTSDGYLNLHNSWIENSYGVRPVINLSSNVKISSGTGTASNPFVVTLD